MKTVAAIALLFAWLFVMALTAAGYLVKMLVDLILTEIVTLYARLGKRIGLQ